MNHTFDWNAYYAAMVGRQPRQNFLAALAEWGDREPGTAIDLGAGDGLESRELARRGWTVTSFDADAGFEARLAEVPGVTAVRRDFTQIAELPASDLVFAGFSLPFCPPEHFATLWQAIRECLAPDGLLAVELFGPDDEWAGTPGMSFHSRVEVEGMLRGLELRQLTEDNRDGRSFDGPKHWHVFHVLARRPGV